MDFLVVSCHVVKCHVWILLRYVLERDRWIFFIVICHVAIWSGMYLDVTGACGRGDGVEERTGVYTYIGGVGQIRCG